MTSIFRALHTIPLISAFILSIMGVFLAFMVAFLIILALETPKAALIISIYTLPGWFVFCGWLAIAQGDHLKPLSDKMFWFVSTIVSFAYFTHMSELWLWVNSPTRSFDSLSYTALLATFLSLLSFLTVKSSSINNLSDKIRTDILNRN